jgi:hypothetical protein
MVKGVPPTDKITFSMKGEESAYPDPTIAPVPREREATG